MLMTSGPFELAPEDSQEVVFACLIARGSDHLSSTTELKRAARKARMLYESGFQPPAPPDFIPLQARGLNEKILLTWDGLTEMYHQEDKVNLIANRSTYYTFQGYNVYQLEDPQGIGAKKRLATYDIVDLVTEIKDYEFVESIGDFTEHTVQYGSDSGIQRYHRITEDELRGYIPLVNNRPYYYAVTAYAYNPDGVPKTLESPIQIVEVYPQETFGQEMQSAFGDSIPVHHVQGGSDGEVHVFIVDPVSVTGHDYQVCFYVDSLSNNLWKLTDISSDTDLLVDQTYQGGDERFAVVDGLLVKVTGSLPGLKSVVQLANHLYDPLPSSEWDDLGTPYSGNHVWIDPSAPSDVNGTGQYFFSAMVEDFEGDLSECHDYEIRFTDTLRQDYSWGEWFYQMIPPIGKKDFGKVPFQLWDVGNDTFDDSLDDVRMIPILYSDGGTPGQWHFDDGAVDLWLHLPVSDRMYFYYPDGPDNDLTYEDFHEACEAGDWAGAGDMWGFWHERVLQRIVYGNYTYAMGDSPGGDPAPGNRVRFITNKINLSCDVFEFSTAGYNPVSSTNLAKQDIRRINVFPNPYFGANVEEMFPSECFVRFTHLPPEATLRIFNLAGELIRTLHHSDGTQFETWDLRNEKGWRVASGMYLVHVDCGKLGQKILKLAVVMPEGRVWK